MKVEIWSDVACPWCYIGKRRFEAALRHFPHRDQVQVSWRSFELDPSAPRRREGDPTEALASKYGISLEQAAAFQQRMADAAAGEGLAFRLRDLRPGNTFDAHRLLHLAADEGIRDTAGERFFVGYLCEGQPIGDPGTLARLATEAGIDPGRAQAVLASDAYASCVRTDEADAAALGITGVPFFVIDRTYGVSGAQPPEVLLSALDQAWNAHPRLLRAATGGSKDGACQGDSCSLAP